jgi:hypothetical protein
VAADVLKRRGDGTEHRQWAGRGPIAHKPYDPKHTPTEHDIRRRMFELCGCIDKPHRGGCDCRSVFNQAASQLWYEHNTLDKHNVDRSIND